MYKKYIDVIEKIYINPNSENWYKNLVIQLVKQLGFDFKIEKSDLESDILILIKTSYSP